jgi:hypothetical protein
MRRRTAIPTLIVTALLLMASAFTASGQLDTLRDTTPEQRAGIQTELMKSRLALTADQTTKVAAINRKYADRMEPVIKSSEGPLAKIRRTREINEAKETELKQVLSTEQFEKYVASKEEMREKLEEKLKEQRR